jgi:hypothetical protein
MHNFKPYQVENNFEIYLFLVLVCALKQYFSAFYTQLFIKLQFNFYSQITLYTIYLKLYIYIYISVSIVSDYRLNDRGSFPIRGKGFFL